MITENLHQIISTLPSTVQLIAVSKTKPLEDLMEAYQAGQRLFGENYPQELAEKQKQLPSDIQWHFIGHLQTNKVKLIAPFVTLIHAVDSMHLLKAIDREAARNNRVIDFLFEFHIANEESKFGLSLDDAIQIIDSNEFKSLKNVRPCGVMGMATFTDDKDEVRCEFRTLKNIFNTLKNNYFSSDVNFKDISMGMSEDYSIAIEEGATLVRIGSLIFGSRIYANKQ